MTATATAGTELLCTRVHVGVYHTLSMAVVTGQASGLWMIGKVLNMGNGSGFLVLMEKVYETNFLLKSVSRGVVLKNDQPHCKSHSLQRGCAGVGLLFRWGYNF